jgi:hypothetical protein
MANEMCAILKRSQEKQKQQNFTRNTNRHHQ